MTNNNVNGNNGDRRKSVQFISATSPPATATNTAQKLNQIEDEEEGEDGRPKVDQVSSARALQQEEEERE